jgi:hypothetical protein
LPPLPSAIPSDEELLAQIAADPDAAPLLSDEIRYIHALAFAGIYPYYPPVGRDEPC